MAARVRWQGTTTQRGYGAAHQAERARRLKRYRPGDVCPHCGQAMTYWPLTVARRYLDLPHNADRSGYLPGLAHRKCNRADGQRIATAIRYGKVTRTWRTSRQW
jgi:hypothetical protein